MQFTGQSFVVSQPSQRSLLSQTPLNPPRSPALPSMAADMAHNTKAREDWRKVNAHIHKEEQTLKELQLDYSEKVAVVEALKMELRQTKNETLDCEQKATKLAQATYDGQRKLQELHRQWEAAQMDRSLLMQQLVAEQDGLKADTAKLEAARVTFTTELQDQLAYIQMLQQELSATQPPGGCSPAVDADTAAQQSQQHALAAGVDA